MESKRNVVKGEAESAKAAFPPEMLEALEELLKAAKRFNQLGYFVHYDVVPYEMKKDLPTWEMLLGRGMTANGKSFEVKRAK